VTTKKTGLMSKLLTLIPVIGIALGCAFSLGGFYFKVEAQEVKVTSLEEEQKKLKKKVNDAILKTATQLGQIHGYLKALSEQKKSSPGG